MKRATYLYKRAGSQNWWLRLQYPQHLWELRGKKKEMSLGTPDRKLAEIKAHDEIGAHRAFLFFHRVIAPRTARRTQGLKHPPGKVVLPQGGYLFADEENLHIFDESGFLRTEPNQTDYVSLEWTEDELAEFLSIPHSSFRDVAKALDLESKIKTTPKVTMDCDKRYLEDWIASQSISPHIAREARNTFETFKYLTDGKKFSDASYDDGLLLADHLFGIGNKYATTKKKVGHLCAIVNFAIKRHKFRGANPFSNVIRKKRAGDIARRLDLDDDDMQRIREAGRTVFSENEWLLWVLLATTGMRLGEALTITSEKTETGIRYVEIEAGKTEQSQRAIPLPESVLPLLPKKITGPLFPGEHAAKLSKRMNRRLEQVGITEKSKVIHSLRHRAKSRLRIGQVPEQVQFELLGHEKKTVADGYGKRHPMTILKPAIDHIGF